MKILIPGLHNSGPAHWQTLLEASDPKNYYRVVQRNWDEPECEAWIQKMEKELSPFDHQDLILIGHSIGCMAIVKWFEHYRHPIKGALFVAPSDAEREGYPTYIRGFTPIPTSTLPFPSILVASTNDHVTHLKRSKEFAGNWGSEFIVLEDAGHIEDRSGFGHWPLAERLIAKLEQGDDNRAA